MTDTKSQPQKKSKSQPASDNTGVVEGKDGMCFQTFSGKLISVLNPKPEDIEVEDMVASLPKQCRYNGHTTKFYSVGEHILRGFDLAVNDNQAKSFLIHDLTEAYIGDLIRPIKVYIPQFVEIEERFMDAILSRLNMTRKDYDHEGVKYIDNFMCAWEKRDLMLHQQHWPDLPEVPETHPILEPWPMEKVENVLRKQLNKLFS